MKWTIAHLPPPDCATGCLIKSIANELVLTMVILFLFAEYLEEIQMIVVHKT